MDWTQAELAQRVGYSVATIRKLERDELRPSKHLAELLAQGLNVAVTSYASFVSFARSTPTSPVELDAQPPHTQRRSNLPAQLTPFFGRTAEIVELTQYMTHPTVRLITIVGPGGMGKTRLALAVAQSLLDVHTPTDSTGHPTSNIQHPNYADGVYFVALAPLRAAEHIALAIAEAISLRFRAGNRLPKQQLLDYLRHKQVLLVLDNFEHLQAGAELMLELLQECPGLHILVTSREQLQLTSETLFVLERMALPSAVTLPAVLSYSAVQLFVETARRVRSKFTPTAKNVHAIVRICQLAGGMPLGIILAAAWVEVLSCDDIVAELSQGFDFLAAELRDLPERQRSMRAVLAQSWQRLTDAERTVFMRLTVFRGGFTRVAAQQVAGASVRMLSSFVNKSLVQCEANRRYTIHEFLRQYAEAELDAADQTADAIRRTHALYHLAMAEQAEPGLIQTKCLEWLEANHDNLRAALNWALDQRDAEIALRLGLALGPFWWTHGYQREGHQWFEAILTISTIRPKSCDQAERWISLRADALNAAALMAWARSDYAQATALHAESLALAQELEKEALIIRSISGLGMVAVYEGDHARATALLTEGLALARKLDEKRLLILPLINLGMNVLYQGDNAQAAVLLIESLAIAQEAEDQTLTAWSLPSLGMVAWLQGDHDRATALLIESLPLSRELDDWWGMTECIEGLAWTACSQGQATDDARRFGRAARLLGAAVALRNSTGNPMPPAYRVANERTTAAICVQLGAATFASAWAEGQTMTLDDAVAYTLITPESTTDG